MKSILTEFNESGMLFDKTTQALMSLPFEYDDIKIKANEFVTYNSYNNVIKKLHYNFLFLYRACNVADFNVFDTYLFSLSSEVNGFKYFLKENTYNSIFYSKIYNSIDAVAINTEFSGNNLDIVFCLNKDNITALSVTSEEGSLLFTNTLVGSISSNVRYGNLVDIKCNDGRNLYVVDDLYKNIYQYDITSLSLNENIFNNKLVLKKTIGGQGDVNERIKFKSIKNIAVNNKCVVVQDYENKCFKIFDINLNWINTSVFVKIFDTYSSFDTILLSEDNTLYCGKDTFIFKFIIENNELIFKDKFNISSYLKIGEKINSLKFFNTDKNILYIITQFSVKKVWVTKLDYIIGQYNVINDGNNYNIKWFATLKKADGKDKIFLYSNNGVKESLSVYADTLKINTLLENINFDVYSLNEDLLLDKNEYVQCWTLTKNLKKIYNNLYFLIQKIKYRYQEEINQNTYPSIKKKIYNTNLLGFFKTITFEDNFNIGVNEIFQSEVLNRNIKEVLDLQEIIMVNLIDNYNEITYTSPEPEKQKSTLKNYLYFVDESLIMSSNPVKLNAFEALSPGAGIIVSLGGAPFQELDGISITDGINV